MADDVSLANQAKAELARQYVLWVDGTGAFLLCLGDEVTIGGLRNDQNHADVCLMSNLSRKHLTLARSNGRYQLTTHESIRLSRSDFPTDRGEQFTLEASSDWKLGEGVEIQFRQPTVLSLTAILRFQNSQRPLVGQPPAAVDQVILMDQNCLVGPGAGQHIEIKDSQEGVILYRSRNQLWCKSKSGFSRNGQPPDNASALESGDIIAGPDFRFRLEALEDAAE
jgi:hypothetical protein